MNKYQEALDSVRKEVKATFFDELGKQWWTNNRDYDYRCNLLQEAIDKANKYDDKEILEKLIEYYKVTVDLDQITEDYEWWREPVNINRVEELIEDKKNLVEKINEMLKKEEENK